VLVWRFHRLIKVINRFNGATVRRFRNGDVHSAKSAVFASPQVYFRVSRFHQSCRARNALYLLPAYSYLPMLLRMFLFTDWRVVAAKINSPRDTTRHLNGSRPMNTAIAALRGTLVETLSVAPIHSRGSLTEPTLLSTRSNSVRPVTDQRIPGFISGLLCGLLFFRRHARFLLFFPVTSSFFRHDVYSRYLIGDLQINYLYIPAAWAGSMMSW